MTNEIKNENGNEFKVIGLSSKENNEFWNREDHFNYIYNRFYNIFMIFLSLSLNLPILTFNDNNTHFYLHYSNTLNLFLFTILIFLLKKLRFTAKKIEKFKNRLIQQWNLLYLEIANLNNYYKLTIGSNFLNFFGLAVLGSFATLSADIKLKLVVSSSIFST